MHLPNLSNRKTVIKEASKRGYATGCALFNFHGKVNRQAIREHATANCTGQGPDAATLNARWRSIFEKAFIRAGLSWNRKFLQPTVTPGSEG
jgi:hypothetical protein